MDFLVTWKDGDGLDGTENTKSTQKIQVNAGIVMLIIKNDGEGNGEVAGRDDEEIQEIPGIPQVRKLVHNKSFGNHFEYHFHRVNPQVDISAMHSNHAGALKTHLFPSHHIQCCAHSGRYSITVIN